MDYSLTQYAEMVGKTRQAIFAQIKENRLPKGVKSKKIGNAIVITVKK
jgi:hypothetical protein